MRWSRCRMELDSVRESKAGERIGEWRRMEADGCAQQMWPSESGAWERDYISGAKCCQVRGEKGLAQTACQEIDIGDRA